MRLWRVVVLVNLAMGVGLLLGYIAWGRQIPQLQGEINLARQRIAVQGVEQTWAVQGVVRAVLPEINVVIVTHEQISGYMPAMTMGFRARDPKVYEGLEVGDSIRFTIRGIPPNVLITEITRQGRS
jgi:Cu/Ag efflux protein CusF